MLWTDGSVTKEGIGGSSCVSCDKPIMNPYNKNLTCPLKACIMKPEGRLCCSYTIEVGGLASDLNHTIINK